MKLNAMILLIIALFSQTAAGAEKKKEGSRLKKALGLSALCFRLHYAQPGSSAIVLYEPQSCPVHLPPNSINIMQYIRCGDKFQTANFYDQYLIDVVKNEKNYGGLEPRSSCPKFYNLWKKTTGFLCMPGNSLKKIVNGAMKRILGNDLGRENFEMFDEQLGYNMTDVDDREVEELSEQFKNLEIPDFFRIMRATDFFKEHKGMKTEAALKEAMKKENQDLDFDQVFRALPYTKILIRPWFYSGYYQVEMAKEARFQKLNFDALDDVREILYKNSLLTNESIRLLTLPENQGMDWKKVVEMIPYAKNKKYWTTDQIKMTFDVKYQQNDPKLVAWIHAHLEILSPNNPQNQDLAMEKWLKCANDADLAKLEWIFAKCEKAKIPLSCYKLQTKESRSKGDKCIEISGEAEKLRGQGNENESNDDL